MSDKRHLGSTVIVIDVFCLPFLPRVEGIACLIV